VTDAIPSHVAEPDWEPTLPPGILGINFRRPLAIICHFRGCGHWGGWRGTHPTHPGQAFYCTLCGRMNREWWNASRLVRKNLRGGGVPLAPGESATFVSDNAFASLDEAMTGRAIHTREAK